MWRRYTTSSQFPTNLLTSHVRLRSKLIYVLEVWRQSLSLAMLPKMCRGNVEQVAVQTILGVHKVTKEFCLDLAYQYLHGSPRLKSSLRLADLQLAACGPPPQLHGPDMHLEHLILYFLEPPPFMLEASSRLGLLKVVFTCTTTTVTITTLFTSRHHCDTIYE